MNQLKLQLGWMYEYFEPFLDGFKAMSYGYPASRNFHHSETGGLFQHSVEVAIKCAEILEHLKHEYIQKYSNETVGSYKARYEKLLFHATLAGLLHDVGKIAVYRAKTKYIYVPFFDSLLHYSDYELTSTQGVDYINSNHLASMVFGILLTQNKKYRESTLFDLQYVVMMLEAIHFQHYKFQIDNTILDILKQADMHSVSETAEIEISLIKQKEEEKKGKQETKKEKFIKSFIDYSLKSRSNYFVTDNKVLILKELFHLLLKQANASEEEVNVQKLDTIRILLYKTNKEYIFSNVYVIDKTELDINISENAKIIENEVVDI